MLNIQVLVDDARCFEEVRRLRWPEGVKCPHCGSTEVIKRGFHSTQPHRQRYVCQGSCCAQFIEGMGAVPLLHGPKPLQYPMRGTDRQIAFELDLNEDDVQQMTTQ